MKILLIIGLIIFTFTFTHSQVVEERDKLIVKSQPNVSNEPLRLTPDEIAVLVSEVGARTTRMTSLIFYKYTYTQADLEYELDKRGQIVREKSKTYEVYPVRDGQGLYCREVLGVVTSTTPRFIKMHDFPDAQCDYVLPAVID